ncbi:MAG: hypothetical protein IKE03_07710 [Blautia sp.]|nr:hypothetical protein [Blautia sp.]
MDKEEFRVKLEEINRLVDKKDYEGAMKVVDSIDWRRVKNVRTLCVVGEIYAANKRYEDSREIFLLAYHRAPIGKNILYRLIEISLKMGDIEEAEEYFQEFMEVAADDNTHYILQYKIQSAKEEPIEEQIKTLESYKDQEFTERWSYELARLYYRAGQKDKCLDLCNEMILWFNEGSYVIKALDLKKKISGLTAREQQLYEKENARKGRDPHAAGSDTKTKAADELSEGRQSDEADPDDPSIGSIEVNNAKDLAGVQSLQERISKGIRDIFGSRKEEEQDDEPDEKAQQSIPEEIIRRPDQKKESFKDIPLLEPETEKGNAVVTEKPVVPKKSKPAVEAVDKDKDKDKASPVMKEFKIPESMQRFNLLNTNKLPDIKRSDINRQESAPESSSDTSGSGEFNLEDTILAAATRQGIEIPDALPQKKKKRRVKKAVVDALSISFPDGDEDGEDLPEKEDIPADESLSDEKDISRESDHSDEEESAEETAVLKEEDTSEETDVFEEGVVSEETDALEENDPDEEAAADTEGDPDKEAAVDEADDSDEEYAADAEDDSDEEYAADAEDDSDEEAAADAEDDSDEEYDSDEEDDPEADDDSYEEDDPEADDDSYEEDDSDEEDDPEADDDSYEDDDSDEDEDSETDDDSYEDDDSDEDDDSYEDDDSDEEDDSYEDDDSDEEDDSYEDDEYSDDDDDIDDEYPSSRKRESAGVKDRQEVPALEEEEFLSEEDLAMAEAEFMNGPAGRADSYEDDSDEYDEYKDEEAVGDERELTDDEKFAELLKQSMKEEDEQVVSLNKDQPPVHRRKKEKKEIPDELSENQQVQHKKPVKLEQTDIIPRAHELDEEEEKLFTYFVRVPGMKEQLIEMLEDVQEAAADKTSRTGNIIVMGGRESGKTRLISSIIPAICRELNLVASKVAYVFAEDINGKDIARIVEKLSGGFLVIEDANQLDAKTVDQLDKAMEQDTNGLIVIIEDEKIGMRKMIARHQKFARKFTSMVNIPVFTNDELVTFAIRYTMENGYKIDRMGMLALYNKIGENQKEDEPMNIGSVKNLLDNAIARAEGGLLKFNRKKRLDRDGYVVLHEKDFS